MLTTDLLQVILITQVGMLTLLMVAGIVSHGQSKLSKMVTALLSSMLTVALSVPVSLEEMVTPVKFPPTESLFLVAMVTMAVNSKVIFNNLIFTTIQLLPKNLLPTIVASILNTPSDAIIQSKILTIVSKLLINQITNIFWTNTMMAASVIMKITKVTTITDTTLMMMNLPMVIMISMNMTLMNTAQTKLKHMNQTIMIQ